MKKLGKIRKFFSSKSAFTAVFWFTMLGFLRPAIGIFLLPLYLLKLTPEDYGILALVGVAASVLGVFSSMGLTSSFRTFYFDYDENSETLWRYMSQIWSVIILISIILFGILFLIGQDLFELIFKSNEVLFYPYGLVAIATGFLSTISSVYFIYLKNTVLIREFAVYNVLTIALTVLFQYYLIMHMDQGVLGVLLGSMVPAILVFIIISFKNPSLFTFKLDIKGLTPSWKFALPLLPFSFLLVFERQIDKLILENYMSLETVGLYALLMGIVGLIIILLSALDNGIRPYLYRTIKKGDSKSKSEINTLFLLYVIIGMIGLSGCIFIGSNIDFITDNIKYISIREYFTFSCLSSIPLLAVRFQALVLVYYKESKMLTIATFIKTFIMLMLMLLLIPQFEINGAIGAVSISYLANAIIFFWLVSKYDNRLDYNKIFIRFSLFAAVVLFSYYFLANYSINVYGIIQFSAVVLLFLFLDLKELYKNQPQSF